MVRRLLPVAALVAITSAGCVPVTEPVGDVAKAEPDKSLVGKWAVMKGNGLAGQFNVRSLTIDAPAVKGNPKGLMHVVMDESNETDLWFFTTTVGKHTYASVILETKDGKDLPKFDKEGAYEAWKKGSGKRFFIFKFVRDGDALTIDCGNDDAFRALMKDVGITGDGDKMRVHYDTPAGWFAEHFGK